MSAFVVLSVAIAVAIVAVTVVVAARLARTVAAMSRGVTASVERLRPLADELQDELAVTQTELEHLQRRADRHAPGNSDGRGG